MPRKYGTNIGLGEGAGPSAPSSRPVRGSALFRHWCTVMTEAASTHTWPLATVDYKVFVVGTRKLREKNNMTDEQMQSLMTEFARQVKIKQIDVNGKVPWFVFLGTWHKLGGSASTSGKWKENEKLSDEDWT